MTYLLDTNVISELRRGGRANRGLQDWVASVDTDELVTSCLVLGELREGVERLRRRDPPQAHAMDLWIHRMKQEHVSHVLPVTQEIAECWGKGNVPDKLPIIDGLLAATAKVMDLTLVTRNTRDVAGAGVRVLNPFTA